jgi:hypothetical protein
MPARLLADALLLLHAGFVLFAVFGGLLALKWRWTVWLHAPAALWAAGIELTGGVCPLTHWENHLRRLAGEAGYATSFIEHHLLGLLYPEGLTRPIQFALAALVVLINAGIYRAVWRRWQRDASDAT